MSLIRKFKCGCVGLALDAEQHQPRKNIQEGNVLVLEMCDPHEAEPSTCFQARYLEQDKIDNSRPLTKEELTELVREIHHLICDGHNMATIRHLMQPRG